MHPVQDHLEKGSKTWFIKLFITDSFKPKTWQGLMKLAGRPVAAFDPDGLIFAAGINSESVKLYDLRC